MTVLADLARFTPCLVDRPPYAAFEGSALC